MRAHDRGFLVVFVASACLSTLPTAVKIGLTVGAATPLQLLAPRMVIGSSFIGLYLLLRRSGGILIDRRGRQSAALAGVFNLLALLFFYWALRRIDAAVGMLVFSHLSGAVARCAGATRRVHHTARLDAPGNGTAGHCARVRPDR